MIMKMKKFLFYFILVLSVFFLIVSIVTWDLFLGSCAFFLGMGLTKFLDEVGL